MASYKVRDHFWLHGLGSEPVPPGTVVELDDATAQLYAHQIEPVAQQAAAPASPAKRKGGAGAR